MWPMLIKSRGPRILRQNHFVMIRMAQLLCLLVGATSRPEARASWLKRLKYRVHDISTIKLIADHCAKAYVFAIGRNHCIDTVVLSTLSVAGYLRLALLQSNSSCKLL